MAIIVNETNIENAICNGVQLDKVVCNGVTVWESWKYTTGEISSGVQQQSQYGVTSMRGKKPVTVRTRWWWAGEASDTFNPIGNTKFTFHYKDGTTKEFITGDTYRDTDRDYQLPAEYQKELDTFDWELRTDVPGGIVRTMTQNYPKFVAWYQK